MPLADPYKPPASDLSAIEAAALDALRAADTLRFRDVCAATALHGNHQATEKALLALRRKGLVTVNYASGIIALRRGEG